MDPFVITPPERARFESQFNALRPINGIVTGDQAKGFFLQSQLPMPILGAIWGLADTDADGKMNINEFSIACKLISMKLRGVEVPKVLPPSLAQLVQPVVMPVVPAAVMKPPVPPAPLIPGVPGGRPMISPPSGGNTPKVTSPPGLVGAQPPPLPPQPIITSQPLLGMSAPIQPPVASVPPMAPMPPMGIPQTQSIPPMGVQPTQPMAPIAPMGMPHTQVIPPMGVPPTQPMAPLPPMGVPPTQPMASVAPIPMATPGPVTPLINPVPPTPAPVPAAAAMERTASIESPLGGTGQLVEWAVPHASKLKYTQLFNTTDRTRTGFLNGVQARNIMMASQLPHTVLAQIWGLSDMDSDGRLSCEEFVLAMHLCDLARSGEKIPVPLPLDLIPPSLRRQRNNSLSSQDGQGDPLAGIGGVAFAGLLGQDLISAASFEDKRKENFEKGQAELERRRKALLEIQRKEQEERERKEREEQEKREKIRLEQERRRQEELEKQLQAQRELEQQKEEERRRAQEQREAARREMERQRQLEWEKQRSLELQAQRQREQENVLKLKAKNQNLSIELSQLNEKVKELSTKITETRSGVTSVKSTIDGMRTTRDTQLQQMSTLKAKLKEQNARLVAVSQEKARMEAKNKMNAAADVAGQEQAKLAFQNKQIQMKQLRDKLQDMEKQIEGKMEDIQNNNSQLDDLKQQLTKLIKDCEELYTTYNEKRNKVLEMKGSKAKEGWGDDAWNSTPAAWNSEEETYSAQTEGYKRYRALYEFVARNGDELSFQPGDIIMVPITQNAEPGWLAGEVRGHSGWFPEAYVECIDTDTGVSPYPEADTIQKTQLEEIAEVPENVSDNGSAVVEVSEAPAVPLMPSLMLGMGTPVDLTVVALYPFTPSAPDQLLFGKGDIIRVTENQDMWWYGENNGQEGWFPRTYVKLSTDNVNINNAVDMGALPPDQQEYYVALYPYASTEPGDLKFNQGEVILVVKKEGEWWTGVIADRTGIFPSNYVQKADTQPVVEPAIEEPVVAPQIQPSQLETLPQDKRAVTPDFAALSSQLESTSSGGEDSDSKGTKGKKPEIATVIAPYQATSPEQLSLQRGQLVLIRKKTSTGWWEGELQAKGKKRQVGWFPASYVKTLGPKSGGSLRSGRVTPSAEPPSTEKVIALYQYKAQNEDELSFEKDDVITIISKDEPAWWRGELNGSIGLFPSNYVAPLFETEKKKIKLSKEEKQRQKSIKELIMTEQAYIDDMSIVHDVFERPLAESKIVTPDELSTIFVNWQDIIVCNHMFLRALRVRREMSEGGVIRMIGDILCESLPRMTVYVRFCSCQLTAAAQLQRLTEQSEQFRQLVRRCQADPRTKGMPLSSFLIKPMQRITKYPLLIQKIVESTPVDHPDYTYLIEALAKAEEFCTQVNEGVREKENSDRLEWLQKHVSFDGLEERLVFNSLTNSVGPRKFLHFGSLTKTKSGKELVGFLMNDFLLLAQPSRPLGQSFSFDRHSHVRFKIYRKPFLLSELVIHQGTEVLDTEVRLEYGGHVTSLTVTSSTERGLWLRRLTQAKEEVTTSDRYKLQRQQSIRGRRPIGVLRVMVVEVTDVNKNLRSGKREVFCEVSMGSQEHHTPVVHTTAAESRWNASMQFLVKDLAEDVLCVTVKDKGYFSPDEFMGRTEVRISDILYLSQTSRGPILKVLPLHEVDSGEVTLKLDLRLFESA
ncbi:intersectin-1 isoform X2 [Macrosteles quadrilineatus]|uniref:intersectin-1 isoform X2 n=1 Tax=Macrosteles quadrilineatus TaxID=74068 RepID=UPI0023E11B2E|nr:intersectin-1 isoform X2 [Macrosteles quadrilineatus]